MDILYVHPFSIKGSTFAEYNDNFVGFMMVFYATHKFYNDRKRLGKWEVKEWESKNKNRMTEF